MSLRRRATRGTAGEMKKGDAACCRAVAVYKLRPICAQMNWSVTKTLAWVAELRRRRRCRGKATLDPS